MANDLTSKAPVLVVDDDADLRSTLALVLGDAGFAVATARDGEEALAWLGAHPRPSVILLDLMMPVLDGWGVLAALRADPALAAIPVVVCTAAHLGDPRLKHLGAAPLMRKPFDLDALVALLQRFYGP